AALAFFWSALSSFLVGKSTSTRTRFFLAYSVNSDLEKTSLLSLTQKPHQSEPVKSSKTSFFSSLALACALGRSVTHCSSSAPACSSAQLANNPTAIFFMFPLVFSPRIRRWRDHFVQPTPSFPPRS